MEPGSSSRGVAVSAAGNEMNAGMTDDMNLAGPRRRRLGFRYLHVIDAVSLFGVMLAITLVRFGFDWPTYQLSHYLAGFAIATAIHMVVYYFGGLYEYEERLGRLPWLPRATFLTLVAVGLDASVALLTGRYLMPRANLIALAVLGTLVVVANRNLARRVRSQRFGQPRILLVGSESSTQLALQHLDESGADAMVAGSLTHAVGQLDRGVLASAVAEAGATDVLLVSDEPLSAIYPDPLAELERRSVSVYRQVTAADTLMGLQRTRQIGGMPFVALRTRALPSCRLHFKRLLDLFYLLVLTPVVVPVALLVGVWVLVRAGSPVLYRQVRVGQLGREFTMLKFRTMLRDAEVEGQAVLASADDPRIVRGLGWLRRCRIDELPQLLNVMSGSMSVVGPRPERPELVGELSARLAGYDQRHDLPPGITGLAQTQAHYQTDAAYKLGHDLQYVFNWSPVLDWTIMAKSVLVMLRGSAR